MFQLITAKLVHVGNSMPSSPDSSSDSSGGSPHHTFDGPNIEAENCLPGVVSFCLSFAYKSCIFSCTFYPFDSITRQSNSEFASFNAKSLTSF